MAEYASTLQQQLAALFPATPLCAETSTGVITLKVASDQWLAHAGALRDTLHFEQLTDLCVVDYLGYGEVEWNTQTVSSKGFSRGVEGQTMGRFGAGDLPKGQRLRSAESSTPGAHRFGVIAHIRSYQANAMLRMRCDAPDGDLPTVPSLTPVWPCADWYEREAFDLFGVVFDGHPDLRRLLTDYGFVGHPFRKDFPLSGNVEVRYDPTLQRVIYEPVASVQPRVGVARVIRGQTEAMRQSATAPEEGA